MSILITGSNGFIGKNLKHRLQEENIDFLTYDRGDNEDLLESLLKDTSYVVHLAGSNRPKNKKEYININDQLTLKITKILEKYNNSAPIIHTSSTQIKNNNEYGNSKLSAEMHLEKLAKSNNNIIHNFRLPNVFGKFCKPNYNSVVATFCFNIVNNIPINIHDPNKVINLVYIDDVINTFLELIKNNKSNNRKNDVNINKTINPSYEINLSRLAETLLSFKESKNTHIIEKVGKGLERALYSTFISYYDPSQFSYSLKKHEDPRGVFVEMLKTKDSGQFSFFTCKPGMTRGGHYHHTKTEKFLVMRGKAKFRFKNICTLEYSEIVSDANNPLIVETVPGWSHDITNIGKDDLYVMLWANEIFDEDRPDTIYYEVNNEK